VAEIIYMSEKKQVTPKSETFEHAGQKYTCRFDPNAPPGEKWVWIVNYTRTYQYFGGAATLEKASVKARRQIHTLNRHVIELEENE
jgi:hypothetical protein